MPARHIPVGLNADASLRAALSALPLAAPDRSAWPAIKAALHAQAAVRPLRHRWLPAALAAGLATAAVLPHFIATSPTSVDLPSMSTMTVVPANTIPTTTVNDDIVALSRRSQQLESWLQRLADGGAPLTGQDLMAATEVEDLIGLVDVQLTTANAQPEAAALWRQRVALLEDLTAIRVQPYAVTNISVAANAAMPSS